MATKITYTQQGDYLLPNLKLPEQPKVEIGIWGKRHLRYLKNHHPIILSDINITDILQIFPPKKGALLPWGSDNF